MPHALVIRHMYSNSLFTIEESFRENDIDFTYVEGFSTDLSKIDALQPDLIVVLGGNMGVYDKEVFPWLEQEIRIIRERIAADKPFLGVCLGAQLAAASQGVRNYKGEQGREYGFFPLKITDEGQKTPLRHFDASMTRVLQMHGDTFDLPANATLLASSDMYVNQAFSIGKNCYAVQFHPEFNRIGLENDLIECFGRVDVAQTRNDADKFLPAMVTQMKLFLSDLYEIWEI